MEKILIIGDGDFSFSVSMIPAWKYKSVVVTCLENEQELCHKYDTAASNIDTIKEVEGWRIVFGVDATRLDESLSGREFDIIRFNFPHSGGKSNIKRNRLLLRDFFLSCRSHLRTLHSRVEVALCRGQGGTEFDGKYKRSWGDSWQVQEMAASAGLSMVKVESFSFGAFYSPTGFRSQARAFSLEGSLLHSFQVSHAELVISDDPLALLEHGLSTYRHAARIYKMNLHQLTHHPYRRTAVQLVALLRAWHPPVTEACSSSSIEWPVFGSDGKPRSDLCASPASVLRTLIPDTVTVFLTVKRTGEGCGCARPIIYLLAKLKRQITEVKAWARLVIDKLRLQERDNVVQMEKIAKEIISDWEKHSEGKNDEAVEMGRKKDVEPIKGATKMDDKLFEVVAQDSDSGGDVEVELDARELCKEGTDPRNDEEEEITQALVRIDINCEKGKIGQFSEDLVTVQEIEEHQGCAFIIDVSRITEALLACSDDPRFLFTDDPRLQRSPVSLSPRSFTTDVSFWLPDDQGFDWTKFEDVTHAICDGTLKELRLLEKYTRPGDLRVSLCVRLTFQSLDRVVSQSDMNRMQSHLRIFLRDNFKVELR